MVTTVRVEAESEHCRKVSHGQQLNIQVFEYILLFEIAMNGGDRGSRAWVLHKRAIVATVGASRNKNRLRKTTNGVTADLAVPTKQKRATLLFWDRIS